MASSIVVPLEVLDPFVPFDMSREWQQVRDAIGGDVEASRGDLAKITHFVIGTTGLLSPDSFSPWSPNDKEVLIKPSMGWTIARDQIGQTGLLDINGTVISVSSTDTTDTLYDRHFDVAEYIQSLKQQQIQTIARDVARAGGEVLNLQLTAIEVNRLHNSEHWKTELYRIICERMDALPQANDPYVLRLAHVDVPVIPKHRQASFVDKQSIIANDIPFDGDSAAHALSNACYIVDDSSRRSRDFYKSRLSQIVG